MNADEQVKVLEARVANLTKDLDELRKVNQQYREFVRTHIEPAVKSVVAFEITRLHELITSGTLKVPHTDKFSVARIARLTAEDTFKRYLDGDWLPRIDMKKELGMTMEDAMKVIPADSSNNMNISFKPGSSTSDE